MKCHVCKKETENEDYVLGWAVLCSRECENKLYKESHSDLDCKSCEDKVEIPKDK
ncbi:MAG: hypothetical protein ACRC1F_02810 [Metamycoplasmataceae bacterium]